MFSKWYGTVLEPCSSNETKQNQLHRVMGEGTIIWSTRRKFVKAENFTFLQREKTIYCSAELWIYGSKYQLFITKKHIYNIIKSWLWINTLANYNYFY